MLKYHLAGLTKLLKAVNAAPGELANQEAIALKSSVDLVKRNVIMRTHRGPGHFGYHMVERWVTSVVVQLRRSVGLLKTDAPQARWLEEGTKAHEIRPSKAQALSLSAGIAGRGLLGQDVLAGVFSVVHHPGEKARHDLRSAYRSALPTIRGYFVGALQRAAKSMATSGD